MKDTIVVTVHTHKSHSKYKKRYRTTKKFHAHDPENQYKEDDTVTIYETKPISKLKRWTVVKPEESKVEPQKPEEEVTEAPAETPLEPNRLTA